MITEATLKIKKLINELQTNKATSYTHVDLNEIPHALFDEFCLGVSQNTSLKEMGLVIKNLDDEKIKLLAASIAANRALIMLELCDVQLSENGFNNIFNALKINGSLHSILLRIGQKSEIWAKGFEDFLKENRCLRELTILMTTLGNVGYQSLANALKVNGALHLLNLHDVDLNEYQMKALTDALMINSSVCKLHLINVPMTHVELVPLNNVLKKNKIIEELWLSPSNSWESGNEVKLLAEALEENRSLLRLRISGAKLNDVGGQYLTNSLMKNRSLQALMLAFNRLENAFALQLVTLLKVHPALKVLAVHFNKIDDKGIKYIAEALNGNCLLESISLVENDFTIEGVKLIAQAIKHNPVLQSLTLGRFITNGTEQDLENVKKDFSDNKNLTQLDLTIRNASLEHSFEIDFKHIEERNKKLQKMAFLMGFQPRLGKGSVLPNIAGYPHYEKKLLSEIFYFLEGEPKKKSTVELYETEDLEESITSQVPEQDASSHLTVQSLLNQFQPQTNLPISTVSVAEPLDQETVSGLSSLPKSI